MLFEALTGVLTQFTRTLHLPRCSYEARKRLQHHDLCNLTGPLNMWRNVATTVQVWYKGGTCTEATDSRL